ncbi:MAG: ABC transporter substrate-binding protein [Gordonia sp. (in: high G+C Gram-positive bacteria)]
MVHIKMLAAGLGMVLAATVAGCSSHTGSSGAASSDSVVLGLGAAPESLDFTTTDGAAIPQVLLDNVYEGLVKLDTEGKIVGDLAKSWTVSPDNLTYDFTLHDGVTFSNGDAFTADAVKFSIERVKSSAWTISLKSYMDAVASVDVVSPTEVKVTLAKPSNDWLFYMTTRIGAIFDPKAVSNLANTAIGTGPYTVAQFNRGQSVVLKSNAHYWGSAPSVPQVTFQYYTDANAENAALMSGSINAIVSLANYDSLGQFENNPKFEVQKGTTTSKVTLSMNNANGPFTNKLLRQAVEYAIDRKSLVRNAAAGYGEVTGSFVPPTDPWFEDLSSKYPYSPDKAKALIAQAGMTGKSIDFAVPNLPAMTTVAQIVQSDLAKVGLNVKIDSMAFPAQWLSTVFNNHNYEMSLISHVEQRDLPTYADPKYYWGYNNPVVRKLIADGQAGTADQQTTAYKKAMEIISDDAVADWLFLSNNVNVIQKGLSGLPKNSASEALYVGDLKLSA